MSKEVWKVVEIKAGKIRMAKAARRGAEGRGGKEARRKGQGKKEGWKYER